MSGAPPSLLASPRERVLPYVVAAVVGHVVVGGGLFVLQTWLGDHAPRTLVDPEQVLTVELLSITPKGAVARAQRAPREASSAAPSAAAEPPPVRSSDLTVQTDTPDPGSKAPAADPKKLDALMRELQMDRLLDDLDAPEGAVDRDAASPDGVEGAQTSLSGGGVGDPEYARYIASVSKLFVSEFRPLPALLGQGLVTVVLVPVDAQGRVQAPSVSKSSGNPSGDRAALAAAELVPTIPLPPERFRDDKPDRYLIRFEDPR